eukprot:3838375-Pleurochrysis_carterae.AAC.3
MGDALAVRLTMRATRRSRFNLSMSSRRSFFCQIRGCRVSTGGVHEAAISEPTGWQQIVFPSNVHGSSCSGSTSALLRSVGSCAAPLCSLLQASARTADDSLWDGHVTRARLASVSLHVHKSAALDFVSGALKRGKGHLRRLALFFTLATMNAL